MSQFQHHAVAIDYQVSGSQTGNSEAVTLLFVHGSYIDQTHWADQVSYFSPRYQVVTLDLPGTSHYPMLESPSLLNEAIEQMISKITI